MPDKCRFPPGVEIRPDGVHELDPCIYEVAERYRNVTVEVRRCKICGHADIAWIRQEDTEFEEGSEDELYQTRGDDFADD